MSYKTNREAECYNAIELFTAQLSRANTFTFMPDSPNNPNSVDTSSLPEYIAHYRILRRLGKGGMGEVLLGEDTKQHGRKVALKVLPQELTRSESRLRRFERHRYLDADAECFVELHWTTPETVAQRFAFDVFGGDVVCVGCLTDLVDGENVRMIERQDRAGFLFEATQPTL